MNKNFVAMVVSPTFGADPLLGGWGVFRILLGIRPSFLSPFFSVYLVSCFVKAEGGTNRTYYMQFVAVFFGCKAFF